MALPPHQLSQRPERQPCCDEPYKECGPVAAEQGPPCYNSLVINNAQEYLISILRFNIPLPAPALLLHEIPHSDAQRELVVGSRQQIRDILRGASSRFLLITGPCSIHDPRAGLICRPAPQAGRPIREKICVVMHCCFEKPRTSTGWKGLITDPHLDGSNDIPRACTSPVVSCEPSSTPAFRRPPSSSTRSPRSTLPI